MRLLLACLLLTGKFLSAQDLYDRDHSGAFAEFLLKSGQYNLAAIELERLHFNEPENDSLKIALARAYTLNQSYASALQTLERMFPAKTSMPNPFSALYAHNLIAADRFPEAIQWTQHADSLSENQRIWYAGFAYLRQNEFQQAQLLLDQHQSAQLSLFPLKELVREGATMRMKKPWLAASLSVLIPGGGKLYTGDWKDALISLVTVGMTGYQAYRGFERGGLHSTYGWIYTTMGTGFYLGNIYGALSSAKRYNQRKKARIQAKIDDAFKIRP